MNITAPNRTTVTTAKPAPGMDPKDIPAYTDMFPYMAEGWTYKSKPGSYYRAPLGIKIPFTCDSKVTQVDREGAKWVDHFEAGILGTADMSIDWRRVPNTNRYRLITEGTWNGKPQRYETDYAVTQARRGYLEFVKTDGSTKKPYYFKADPLPDGSWNVDFEIDMPMLGLRMMKYGRIWPPAAKA